MISHYIMLVMWMILTDLFLLSYPGWNWTTKLTLKIIKWDLYLQAAEAVYNWWGWTWQDWLVFWGVIGFPALQIIFLAGIHYYDIPIEWGRPQYIRFEWYHWRWHWQTVAPRDVIGPDGNKTGEQVFIYGW